MLGDVEEILGWIGEVAAWVGCIRTYSSSGSAELVLFKLMRRERPCDEEDGSVLTFGGRGGGASSRGGRGGGR